VYGQKEFTLPNSDIYRNLFMIKKINATPKKYPRKAGLPSKEPL
jgi:16S rRNA (guanine527-N7)-methyltransferase